MEYEYMRALRQRFFVEPDMALQREIEASWRRLSERVSREDQKRILGLVDLQAALLDEFTLASFTAGFQVALGIARDEEARAGEMRDGYGKAQG